MKTASTGNVNYKINYQKFSPNIKKCDKIEIQTLGKLPEQLRKIRENGMAKKHMDFIRKAGGQKAKKLLAVILAAGMAMTALPGETITALAQEAEGQKNVLLAEEVSGSLHSGG